MSVFDAALGRIFANPSMAVAALWLSATSSEERSIHLIRRAPDQITEFGGARLVSDTMVADVRVIDLPDLRSRRLRPLPTSGRGDRIRAMRSATTTRRLKSAARVAARGRPGDSLCPDCLLGWRHTRRDSPGEEAQEDVEWDKSP